MTNHSEKWSPVCSYHTEEPEGSMIHDVSFSTLALCLDCKIKKTQREAAYIHLQEVEHARLSNFFRLIEFLQSLAEFFVWNLALSLLLIIKV